MCKYCVIYCCKKRDIILVINKAFKLRTDAFVPLLKLSRVVSVAVVVTIACITRKYYEKDHKIHSSVSDSART